MGMRIGYARVSSSGQKLDNQLDRLADYDRIYHEKASAASAKSRPELQKGRPGGPGPRNRYHDHV
jgi:DNA invertase Pin-like site-specific DNA recombinase